MNKNNISFTRTII